MKNFNLLAFICALFFCFSCSKKDEPIVETPPVVTDTTIQVTFWSATFSNVTVTINGQSKQITGTTAVAPACGAGGGPATFTLPVAGTYTWSATTSNGSTATDTRNFADSCFRMELK